MIQRLLRRREVEQLTGLKRSTIYELVAAGEFPKPVPISAQAVAWLESEIAAWQKRCIASRDTPGA
jgi:prophage regulatory protein